MEADNIAGGKEPKRLPVWACIPLFIVILFILLGLYGTLARGCLSLVLGVEARYYRVLSGRGTAKNGRNPEALNRKPRKFNNEKNRT